MANKNGHFANAKSTGHPTYVKLRPVSDRVVVRPEEPEDESPGGIVLPDVAQERPQRGTVLAVGPGRLLEDGTRAEMEVCEGDTVLFAKYSGTDVEVGEETVKFLRPEDILAVIEE